MSGRIHVDTILTEASKITIGYSVSGEVSRFFRPDCTELYLEYFYSDSAPVDLSAVPRSLAVIPFVGTILPLVFLTDSCLELPEADSTFLDAVADIRNGFATVYPEYTWRGTVTAAQAVDNRDPSAAASAMFFSGGVDSTSTFVDTLESKPDLLTIWGADVSLNNFANWDPVRQDLDRMARDYGLTGFFIRTNFKDVLNYDTLGEDFPMAVRGAWWLNVQHGVAILGIAAPLSGIRHWRHLYLAASLSSDLPLDDPHAKLGSRPEIDDSVRFASVQANHEGFEKTRQARLHNILMCAERLKTRFKLRVCYRSRGRGANCGNCEKCIRTIYGILAEGGDPEEYGFSRRSIWFSKAKVMPHLTQSHYERLWKEIREKLQERPEFATNPHMRWLAELNPASLRETKRKPTMWEKIQVNFLARYFFH